ncbi:hypothetical protein RhiJN_25167 [Ceratobasidium sp. AG-Ba]|nr:hypothetical protein RhiJN_25167 [Ceratobasidium sp. AG-Ba]
MKEIYREKYPCIIFPSSTTYTPPQLPAHIPVSLEPVTNSPSNSQIKSVQTALRLSENLANVPSIFDPDLSMQLSQHLFDIQFGRYIWKTANREYDRQSAESSAYTNSTREPQKVKSPNEVVLGDLQNQGPHDIPSPPPPSINSSPEISGLESEIASLQSELSTLKASMEEDRHSHTRENETNQLLGRLCEGVDEVKRAVVGAQHCMARGINAGYGHYASGAMQYSHSLINNKGETPESVGLPSTTSAKIHLSGWGEDKDYTLARYLRFYNIGKEFIREGEEGITIGSLRSIARTSSKIHNGSQ